jgi:predicted  nucleic acid-binding Zn-ribbon protein
MGGEMGELKVKISEQSDTIVKQGELIRQLSAQIKKSKEHFDHGIKESEEDHRNTKEELRQVREQLEAIKVATSSLRSSPQPSYANVARTPPLSQPTNLPTLSSMHTTPSSFTDTIYCTVDTSRVEEGDRRKAQAFSKVATAVAEAEASIQTVQERHTQAATRLWVNVCTLPQTHPLARSKYKAKRRFVSPMQKIAMAMAKTNTERLETIHEYTIPPWSDRIPVVGEHYDYVETDMTPNDVKGIITTASSQKGDTVGMGGVVRDTTINNPGEVLASYCVTIGTRDEQNPCTAELAAIAMALKCMPAGLHRRDLTVMTSNRSALQVIRRPRQQSGQCTIRQIYERTQYLQRRGCSISLMWVAAEDEGFTLRALAKAAAKRAAMCEETPDIQPYQARSTKLRLAKLAQQQVRKLPEGVGKYSKRVDTALPGKHTRELYDQLNRRESDILVQSRTGMARLNGFLHRIGAADSSLCECGQATETVEHFLFRCRKWIAQRNILLDCSQEKIGNLSYFLGGKARSDNDKWKPDIGAVKAAIKFAMATGRLVRDQRPPD